MSLLRHTLLALTAPRRLVPIVVVSVPLVAAQLLARIFAIDITRCRTCGGRMRVLGVVSDANAIARILHGARAPPAPPPPGQVLLFA